MPALTFRPEDFVRVLQDLMCGAPARGERFRRFDTTFDARDAYPHIVPPSDSSARLGAACRGSRGDGASAVHRGRRA